MQVLFESFIGNQAVKERLSCAIRAGKASHAYLLEGRAGSGKKTLAYHITAALNCENIAETVPCGVCLSCRKIYRGISPDVVYISCEKNAKSIGVEKIRRMLEHIQIAPNDLQMKVYVIDDAHKMTEQAQNALLKMIEEPPGRALFLLLCEDSGALLPTVRSRTQHIRMELFSDAELSGYVIEHEPAAKAMQKNASQRLSLLLRLSAGTIGGAKNYLAMTEDKLEADLNYASYQKALKTLEILCGTDKDICVSKNIMLINLLTDGIRDREQVAAYTEKLIDMARDIICVKKGLCSRLLFFLNENEAEQAAMAFTEAGISAMLFSIIRYRQMLSANPNLQLLLQNICRSSLSALA